MKNRISGLVIILVLSSLFFTVEVNAVEITSIGITEFIGEYYVDNGPDEEELLPDGSEEIGGEPERLPQTGESTRRSYLAVGYISMSLIVLIKLLNRKRKNYEVTG